MKHLNEEWRDLLGKLESEKRYLEQYIQTPQGAREAVEWLVAMFAFCVIDALWATWNLWHLLLGSIL
jgi:hypothetical protein